MLFRSEEAGYQVYCAENGISALESMKKISGISLVISDIVMPEMDGRNMVRELSSIAPSVKVLLMSGYAYEESPVGGFDNSSYEFIQKPFTENHLIRKVIEVLALNPSS